MQHPPEEKPRRRRRFRYSSARYVPPGPFYIRDFKTDPSKFLILTKSATLAIRDYNSQTQTDYQFVDIEMVTWRMVNGNIYQITFQARNSDKEYRTLEANVLNKTKSFRKVMSIMMKGSNTWYDGTLMQLEDDAPIIMDVKDHDLNRDVYALMRVAQQFRMPDMGSVMARQDEGAEAASALVE